jgi:hypothetical protein
MKNWVFSHEIDKIDLAFHWVARMGSVIQFALPSVQNLWQDPSV